MGKKISIQATKGGKRISDEIEELLNGLSAFDDDIINSTLSDLFSDESVMSDLDASGLCVLLINKKENIEGQDTAWFDMEQV